MLSVTPISGVDYFFKSACLSCGMASSKDDPLDYVRYAMSRGEPAGMWAFRGEKTLDLEGSIDPNAGSGDAARTLVNELRDPTQPKVWEEDPPPNGQRRWRKDQEPTGAWRHPRLGEGPREFRSVAEQVAEYKAKHPNAMPEEVTAFKVKAQGQKREARHAYDLQFSTPKSWGVLHAAWQLAERNGDADKLWAAIMKGIDAALDQAADEVGWTRKGVGGPKIAGRATTRYERNRNFVMAIFRHHTSRDREPQLHAHVMLLNRLLCEDGEWRALHAAHLFKSKPMLTQTFLRVAEAEATRTLGLQFETDPVTGWREIVGVDREVRAEFESRTRALTGQAQDYIAEHNAVYGTNPDAFLTWKMNQRAAYETRGRKPKTPPTRAEDLAAWQAATAARFRGGLTSVVGKVDAVRASMDDQVVVRPLDREKVIEQALADLDRRNATWNRASLYHYVSRRMEDMLAVEAADIPALIMSVTEQALRSPDAVPIEVPSVADVPAELRDRESGRSVFEAPEGERYTTRTHLERENTLVARLEHIGAPTTPAGSVRASLAGAGLDRDQEDGIVGIRTSGRRIELIQKPAGAGGTRMVAALSASLRADTGRGVVGFALARNAAEVMAREGIENAHSIAAYLLFHDRAQVGEVSDVERADYAIAPGSTVVIDEATMADTPQLARLVSILLDEADVGQIVMVGDTEQVDAPDAAGAFAMLVRERDDTARAVVRGPSAAEFAPRAADFTGAPKRELVPVRRLNDVRRFTSRWEREASARLHDGDLTALAEYDTRGRIMGDTDPVVVKDAAAAGFVRDHLSGLDSIVVVASEDEAVDVSSRVRQRLVDAGHVERGGVGLRDGFNVAGVGDIVQTRLNNDALGVNNRDRWQVIGTSSRGDLEVRLMMGRDARGEFEWGAPQQLPAPYVAEHVELAYAGTVEAVQGRTTDTGHVIAGRWMGRSRLYPGWTRGRDGNWVYVMLDERPREAVEAARERVGSLERKLEGLTSDVNRDVLNRAVGKARSELAHEVDRQETPVGRLAEVLENDDHTLAARTAIADEQARARNLGHLGVQWQQLVTEDRGVEHRRVLNRALSADDVERVLADPASANLFHLLRCAEMSGHHPRELLDTAMADRRGNYRSLSGSGSPAAVLYARCDDVHARMSGTERVGFTYTSRTNQAPRTPEGLYALRIARVMDERTTELGELAAADPEPWMVAWFGPVPDGDDRYGWVGRVAIVQAFREEFGWSSDRHPIGPAPTRGNPEKLWAWSRAARILGMDPRERDLSLLSRGELHSRVQEWDRERGEMPVHVEDRLRFATRAQEGLRQALVEARTAGEDTAELVEAQRENDHLVEMLEEIATYRRRAVRDTELVRARAEEARAELARRAEVDRARQEDERPVPDEPELEEDREPEAEAERALERELTAREAPARDEVDPEVLAAVFEHASRFRLPDRVVPELFSREFFELAEDDPARRASVELAALARFRAGSPLSREEITELSGRVARAEAEAGTDGHFEGWSWVSRERRPDDEQRGGDGDRGQVAEMGSVSWLAPGRDDGVDAERLAAVHAYTGPLLSRDVPAPRYGSAEWRELDVDDPARESASAAYALEEWNFGDNLSSLQARAEAAEDVVSRREISRAVEEHRETTGDHRTYLEVERARAESAAEREAAAGEAVRAEKARQRAEAAREREGEQRRAEVAEREVDRAAERAEVAELDRSRHEASLEGAARQREADEQRRDAEQERRDAEQRDVEQRDVDRARARGEDSRKPERGDAGFRDDPSNLNDEPSVPAPREPEPAPERRRVEVVEREPDPAPEPTPEREPEAPREPTRAERAERTAADLEKARAWAQDRGEREAPQRAEPPERARGETVERELVGD